MSEHDERAKNVAWFSKFLADGDGHSVQEILCRLHDAAYTAGRREERASIIRYGLNNQELSAGELLEAIAEVAHP